MKYREVKVSEFGERKLVGRIHLSDYTEVRVSTSSKDGIPCVDVRLFYADMRTIKDIQNFIKDKPAENFLPTKKGLFLAESKFTELMEDLLIPLHKKLNKK